MYLKPLNLLNVRIVIIFFCSYHFPLVIKALVVLKGVKAKKKLQFAFLSFPGLTE